MTTSTDNSLSPSRLAVVKTLCQIEDIIRVERGEPRMVRIYALLCSGGVVRGVTDDRDHPMPGDWSLVEVPLISVIA